jgi:hypothetical protein
VANRGTVTLSFDPFNGNDPAATVSLPLYALIILLLIVGVLIGGIASWSRQGRWRGAARRFEREAHALRGKVATLEGMRLEGMRLEGMGLESMGLEGTGDRAAAAPPARNPPPERLRLRPPA